MEDRFYELVLSVNSMRSTDAKRISGYISPAQVGGRTAEQLAEVLAEHASDCASEFHNQDAELTIELREHFFWHPNGSREVLKEGEEPKKVFYQMATGKVDEIDQLKATVSEMVERLLDWAKHQTAPF